MRQGLSDDEKEAHVKEVKETMSILNSLKTEYCVYSIVGSNIYIR